MNPSSKLPAVAGLAAVLILAGCSASDTTGQSSSPAASSADSSATASSATASASSASAEPSGSSATQSGGSPSASTTAKGKEVYKGVTVAGGKDETPVITLADNFKPVAALHKIDLYQGKGDPVVDGSTVTVNYVGMGQQSKQVFDSSFERGAPISFPLTGVIEGWQEGLIGMQPGGRRVLIIPGDMAYGSAGNPPAIGADETLVFVVDLKESASASAG